MECPWRRQDDGPSDHGLREGVCSDSGDSSVNASGWTDASHSSKRTVPRTHRVGGTPTLSSAKEREKLLAVLDFGSILSKLEQQPTRSLEHRRGIIKMGSLCSDLRGESEEPQKSKTGDKKPDQYERHCTVTRRKILTERNRTFPDPEGTDGRFWVTSSNSLSDENISRRNEEAEWEHQLMQTARPDPRRP